MRSTSEGHFTTVVIQDSQPMPQWSFKRFGANNLAAAIKWVETHPQYQCRVRKSSYSARDTYIFVNYRKAPVLS